MRLAELRGRMPTHLNPTRSDERYPYLFPGFPGCDIDCGLHTTLVFSDRNTRVISDRDMRAISGASRAQALETAVSLYAEEITALADENRVDVLIVARPEQLIDTTRRAAPAAVEKDAAGSRAVAESGDCARLPQFANFHDLLKARVLQIRQPIQIIRRSTWDESVPPPAGHSRQDEASRAWNLHVDDTTLDTSVAQVFNERGDGVIVRGGPARVGRDDRQPHLTEHDAHALLLHALATYHREHRTLPARLVLHKTSSFTAAESRHARRGKPASLTRRSLHLCPAIQTSNSYWRHPAGRCAMVRRYRL